MIPTLKTKRLKLRPLTFSDLDAMISAIMSDRDVMRWLPYSHAVSTPQGQREVAAGYLKDFIKPEIERVYAVTDRGNLASRTVMEKAGMAFEKEVDLYDSVAKGNGLLPFYSLDRTGFRRETGQTDGVVVREAEEPDCVNLAALSLEVWLTTYSFDGIRTENSEYALSMFTARRFRELLNDGRYRLLVAVRGIYLRGYILVNLESRFKNDGNGFEIDKLYVQGPFQGQGIGKALLLEVKARYGNRFWLTSWVYNKSIGFYKKFGFKDLGRHDFKLGDESIENRVLAYVNRRL